MVIKGKKKDIKINIFAKIKERPESLKTGKGVSWLFIFEIVLMIVICLLHALGAGHYAEFHPINGTFQNFNPVRRLLDGQVPYRDFQDYLGLGHLYMGTIMTAILGGDYQGSLIAFSFLTLISPACCSLMIGMAIFKKKEYAGALTDILLLIIVIQPSFFTSALAGIADISGAFNLALDVGNSARFVRGLMLPLACLLAGVSFKIVNRISVKRGLNDKKRDALLYIGAGIAAGISFSWSNDYGISCWVCLCLMIFWVCLCRTRKFLSAIIAIFTGIAASVAGIFVSVTVLTAGHVMEWFESVFGTGGYQAWYYNSNKSYYLYDVDFSYIMLIQAGIVLFYLWKLYMTKGTDEAIRRYGIPAFANMTCFCAVNEYRILSGGVCKEVAMVVLFLTIFYELVYLLKNIFNQVPLKNFIYVGMVIVGAAWCMATLKEEVIFSFFSDPDGVYVEAMGGQMRARAEELMDTKEFLNGEDFFATYASAQEVVSDTYQPSGTDYIIHVLGDKQRERYLESFQNGDFKYAACMKDTDSWIVWEQRADWYFFRELYRNWHPVYSNSYEVYWERNDEMDKYAVQSGIKVAVQEIDECTKKIIVTCDTPVNGAADVYIDYEVKKKERLSSKLLIQTILNVKNTGVAYVPLEYEMNYLRPKSAEYIQIPVVNGYGETTLTSFPERNTYLELNEAECNKIYTVLYDFLEISSINMQGDGTSVITSPLMPRTVSALEGAKKVCYNGVEHEIMEITKDDKAAHIQVAGSPEKTQSNIIELIR